MSDDWNDQAACLDVPTEVFYPEVRKGPGGGSELYSAAKAICNGCPSKHPCREWAIAHGEWGIWGGTTEQERDTLRRGRPSRRAT